MTAERLGRIRAALARWSASPVALVAFPLLLPAVHRKTGETGLLVVCVATAAILALLHLVRSAPRPPVANAGPPLAGAEAVTAYLDALCEEPDMGGTACLAISPDGRDVLERQMGAEGFRVLMEQLGSRLDRTVRGDDLVAILDTQTIGIVLAPSSRLSVESVVQTALRLQRCLQMPFDTGKGPLALTVSVGVALTSRMPEAGAEELIAASRAGLAEALVRGPRAIRLSESDGAACPDAVVLARDLDNAFESGQIVPHFQPQICTDTGALTGLEALARWEHPTLGLLGPGDFLPTIEAAQALPQLTDHMVHHALDALAAWEAAGIYVPRVSVNFSLADLMDPALPDRIAYALDLADLGPSRLGIEVLETVLAVQGDTSVETVLARLHAMGCHVDLDDFGTGNSSIANIRRFAVDRLKIDGSFVSGIDACRDKQAMVAAILTMADQLGLEVLAEGVETQSEHAMLSQLGCAHVQGFGLGRPMEGASLPGWVARRRGVQRPVPLPQAFRDALIAPSPPTSDGRRDLPGAGKTA